MISPLRFYKPSNTPNKVVNNDMPSSGNLKSVPKKPFIKSYSPSDTEVSPRSSSSGSSITVVSNFRESLTTLGHDFRSSMSKTSSKMNLRKSPRGDNAIASDGAELQKMIIEPAELNPSSATAVATPLTIDAHTFESVATIKSTEFLTLDTEDFGSFQVVYPFDTTYDFHNEPTTTTSGLNFCPVISEDAVDASPKLSETLQLDPLGLQLMTGPTKTEFEQSPFADLISQIDKEIAELAEGSNDLLLLETELSSQQSLTEIQDDLSNYSAGTIASEFCSPLPFIVPRDVPLTSTSSLSSWNASLDSPVPLMSIVVKPNNEKNWIDKTPPELEDRSCEKRVTLSDKDEIFIVLSLQNLARAHDEQEDYREVDISVAATTSTNSTSESLTTATAVMSNSINVAHHSSPQHRLAVSHLQAPLPQQQRAAPPPRQYGLTRYHYNNVSPLRCFQQRPGTKVQTQVRLSSSSGSTPPVGEMQMNVFGSAPKPKRNYFTRRLINKVVAIFMSKF